MVEACEDTLHTELVFSSGKQHELGLLSVPRHCSIQVYSPCPDLGLEVYLVHCESKKSQAAFL